MQEFSADAIVEPHAARHLLHVGANLFAQVGDFVDEGNLGGEKRIGRVFDQFGGAPANIDDRQRIQIKRPVDFGEHGAGARVVGADHDAVRVLEVLDRGAFAQKFRIGDDLDFGVGPFLTKDVLDLVAGTDRNGGLGDDDSGARKKRRNLAYCIIDEAQIGVAVAAPRRRADRDEHRLRFADAGGVNTEFEPALPHIGFDQIGEARFEDRNLAAIKRGDFIGVLVDAGHLVAEIGKAGPGNEPDISGADHGHAHCYTRSRSDPIRPGGRGGGAFEFIECSGRRNLRVAPYQRKPAPPEQHQHETPIDQAADQRQ